MILWHIGASVAIVRYVFRDPKMDLRYLAVGALLPDLIDKPIGALFFHDQLGNDRVYGHTLLFSAGLMAVVMLATRRGTARRKAWLGFPIGGILHVFLDAHWTEPDGLWWPFLGWGFPDDTGSQLWTLIGDRITDPFTLVGEGIGLAYLIYLYRVGSLGDREKGRQFLKDGRLPMPRSA